MGGAHSSDWLGVSDTLPAELLRELRDCDMFDGSTASMLYVAKSRQSRKALHEALSAATGVYRSPPAQPNARRPTRPPAPARRPTART